MRYTTLLVLAAALFSCGSERPDEVETMDDAGTTIATDAGTTTETDAGTTTDTDAGTTTITDAGTTPEVDAGTPDPTTPTIESALPVNNSMNAPVTAASLVFSEPMDQASVESAFSTSPASTGAFNWGTPKSVVYLPAAGFPFATKITVTLAATAKSSAGATIAAPYSWAFTTQPNRTPPTVSTDPANGATNVPTSSSIRVTFSQPMDSSALGSVSLTPQVAATIVNQAADKSAFTLLPSQPLAARTQYTVTVSNSLGANGVRLATPYVARFTTAEPQAGEIPEVVSTVPARGTMGVGPNTGVRVNFSKSMNVTTARAAMTVMNGGVAVPGTVSLPFEAGTLPSSFLWFLPTGGFPRGATITVKVAKTATDASGNPLAADYAFGFGIQP